MERNREAQSGNTHKVQSAAMNSYHILQDPNFIKLKLDTSNLLENIEVFLSNRRTVIKRDEETGSLYETIEQIGRPLANEEGIARILGSVHMIANNHSVQGNTKSDEYYNLVADIWESIAKEIVENCYEWNIHDKDLQAIIQRIIQFFRLFLSRTIDNKERESLSAQFKSSEIVRQDEKTGITGSIKGVFR